MLRKIIIQDRKYVAWDMGVQKEERSLLGGKTKFGFLEEMVFEPDFKGWEGFVRGTPEEEIIAGAKVREEV